MKEYILTIRIPIEASNDVIARIKAHQDLQLLNLRPDSDWVKLEEAHPVRRVELIEVRKVEKSS